MEILTRGPIHEAFAEVGVDQRQPGVVISRPVPAPINEIPPDFRPDGDNVAWISGYWSWDDEKNDFIWVSGVWRDIPPGRQWVSGYWIQAAGGNQYVSGFWRSIDRTETVYLPPPPQQLGSAPSSPALSPSHVWVNGSWVWYQNGYAWQGGYWLASRPKMIWIPAHYIWSPRGYVYVRGYWDYHLERRGVLFAPRYYPRPIYRNHGYFYTPRIVLDIDAVFLSLFIRWDSRHYYFGDYHGAHYERRGFSPWYSKRATRYGYDPFYQSYRQHRQGKDKHWENNYRRQFQYRRDHKESRPPRIYRSQINHNFDKSRRPADNIIGRRLEDVVVKKNQSVRFTRSQSDGKRVFSSQDNTPHSFQPDRKTLKTAPFSAKPQREYQENQRVRSQKETVYRSRVTQQEGQHLERQNKYQQPFRSNDQKKQYMAPKGQIKEKPQSQQHTTRHSASPERIGRGGKERSQWNQRPK